MQVKAITNKLREKELCNENSFIDFLNYDYVYDYV